MLANNNPQPDRATVRFLIVDDELLIAQDLSAQIQRLGHQVVGIASSADKAIALAGQQRPDIVLMDVQLGQESDGISAAQEIRAKFGVPSIFITAYADRPTLTRAQEVQPLGYLVKPIRSPELEATLLMSIAQHRLTQVLAESLSWLNNLVREIPEGVFAADRSGAVRFMNRAAELLTGNGAGESVGQPLNQILRVQDASVSDIGISAIPPSGQNTSLRAVITSLDGRETPVEYSAFEMATGNQIPPERIIIVRDISERVQVERLIEAEKGRLAAQIATTSAELGRTKQELRALAANLMHAQEEERRRVARHLHDDLAQQLACIQMKSDNLAKKCLEEPGLLRELGDLRQLLDSLANQIRHLSHGLHPSTLEHLGLAVALQDLGREFGERNPELLVRISVPEKPTPLAPEAAIGIYRIAAESLRNVEKHADASAVSLKLFCGARRLGLAIRDYGRGFEMNPECHHPGLGLISMQERSLALGGNLKVCTKPGSGTLVALTVPYGNDKAAIAAQRPD